MLTSPLPKKIVTYSISGDSNGGALHIYGDSAAKRVAIMCPGFPDDQSIFGPFASRLAKETDTLVGVTCIPGYDVRDDKSYTDRKRDGYSFDEMVESIREAVKTLRSESTHTESNAELVALFHDWGSVPGMIWCNRSIADDSINAPHKMVLFDVCGGVHPKMKDRPKKSAAQAAQKFHFSKFCNTFITWYYKIAFACVFVVLKYAGDTMARLVNVLFLETMRKFPIAPLFPFEWSMVEKNTPDNLYRCYPYYKIFQSMFTGKIEAFKDCTLPLDLNKTPCLFLYGPNKRINFHGQSALAVLEREHREGRSKSNAVAVDDAGHWLYVQKLDTCLEHVKSFLE